MSLQKSHVNSHPYPTSPTNTIHFDKHTKKLYMLRETCIGRTIYIYIENQTPQGFASHLQVPGKKHLREDHRICSRLERLEYSSMAKRPTWPNVCKDFELVQELEATASNANASSLIIYELFLLFLYKNKWFAL